MNLEFKSTKKYIEKSIHSIVSKVQNYKKGLPKDIESAQQTIEQALENLRSLKAKYLEMLQTEDKLLDICGKRVQHIVELKTHYKDSRELIEAYHLTRMDRLLLDYFLRERCYETAKAITREADLENFSDISVFLENERIAAELLKHDVGPAINWCVTHKTKLGNMKSTLEMELRIQEFIELVKECNYTSAMAYAEQHFAKYMEESPLLIKRVMALIAVHTSVLEGLSETTYSDLLSDDRWSMLVGSFERESYRMHSLTTESLLSLNLQAGLSSLKTVFCDDPNTKKEHCPTCSRLLGELAKTLPYSCHVHTSVVCKITGEIMDENNPPMLLPNGYVYSEKGLLARMNRAKATVTCPATNESFPWDKVKKIFFC